MPEPTIAPPQDTDAEEAALGSALVSDRARETLLANLVEDDYYRGANRLVHRAIAAMVKAGDAVDVHTVNAWLAKHLDQDEQRVMAEWGGRGYVLGLAGSSGWVSAHAYAYARQVRETATLRRTISACLDAERAAATGRDAAELLAELERVIGDLRAGASTTTRVRTAREAFREWVDEARRDATDGGIRLGWPTIDFELTTPLRRGEVVVFAARTAVGKTWALLDVTANAVSRRSDIAALVSSLEMPRTDIVERLAAQTLDVPTQRLREAATTGDDAEDVTFNAGPYLDRVAILDGAVSVGDLPLHIAAARRRGLDIGIVCVDYLQLLRWDGWKSASVYERVSETARALKAIALQEGVLMLVAGQLNRAAKSGGERPTLDMLRDSGAIEEAADRIIALWAPAQNEDDPALKASLRGVVRACILKNRKGNLGDVAELRFTTGFRLRELAPAAEAYA